MVLGYASVHQCGSDGVSAKGNGARDGNYNTVLMVQYSNVQVHKSERWRAISAPSTHYGKTYCTALQRYVAAEAVARKATS